jgi:hypothetical protein
MDRSRRLAIVSVVLHADCTSSTWTLTEFSTTSVCGIDEARENRTAAYGHTLIDTVVVGVIKIVRQLDHDRILHNLQRAAVAVASALSEENHILRIGVLDLMDVSVICEIIDFWTLCIPW